MLVDLPALRELPPDAVRCPLHAELGPLAELHLHIVRTVTDHDESHEVYAVGGWPDAPVVLYLEAPGLGDLTDLRQAPLEVCLIPSDDDDVVHVPEVPHAVHPLLHVVVQFGEVEIRPILRGVVSDRHPVPFVLEDDAPAYLQQLRVLDASLQLLHQDVAVDVLEVLLEVDLEEVESLLVPQCADHVMLCLMGTPARQCSVGLRYEVRHQHIVHAVDDESMDQPVGEVGKIHDVPRLSLLVDLKMPVLGGMVGHGDHDLMQLLHALLEVLIDLDDLGPTRLAYPGLLVCPLAFIEGAHLRIYVRQSLRHVQTLPLKPLSDVSDVVLSR